MEPALVGCLAERLRFAASLSIATELWCGSKCAQKSLRQMMLSQASGFNNGQLLCCSVGALARFALAIGWIAINRNPYIGSLNRNCRNPFRLRSSTRRKSTRRRCMSTDRFRNRIRVRNSKRMPNQNPAPLLSCFQRRCQKWRPPKGQLRWNQA